MIQTDITDQRAILTLHRPEKANALTADMLEALTDALDRIATQDQKLTILTGSGSVFSAGADLDAAKQGLATSPLWERLSARVATMPCLTIAALNGTVAGGAMGMVLACDLRVAVPEARFFYPVMKLGYEPQPSDARRLVALVGPSRAKMILMAGQKISAEEARIWGLVDKLAADCDPVSAAMALAADALGADAGHVAVIKSAIPMP